MKPTRMATCLVAVALTILACSRPGAKPGPDAGAPPEAEPTFINRVWKVGESSSIPAGQLYVFLSEGTLVMASPHSKPSLGTWALEKGVLTMVEEGISYSCDILGLSKTEFRIRSNNPGDPVEIRFVIAGP